MKFTHLSSLTLGLMVGLATAKASSYDAATGTGTVWAQGVSQEGGWYDAQKTSYYGDADDYMCYEACAANQIAWWQNSEYGKNLSSSAPKDINDIWQTYVNSNQLWNDGGDPASALNWWISGVYAPTTEAEWKRCYAEKFKEELPLTLAVTNGYYFDQYGLTSHNLSDFIFDACFYGWSKGSGAVVDFKELFESGACISLTICFPDANIGHAITLWGVDYTEDGLVSKLWITDSDDGSHEITSIDVLTNETGKVYFDEDGDIGIYEYYPFMGISGIYIYGVSAIHPGACSAWQFIPEPATTTLSLLAMAGLAARCRRKH